MMKVAFELVFNCVLLVGPVCATVRWDIKSPKIVFGGNVTLFCNTSAVDNACKGCPTSWFGGKNSDVLSYNGFPSSNSKYASTTAKDGFGITIKNLTEKDLHYPYTCSYGFISFVNNITLDETYEYRPSKDEIQMKHDLSRRSMLYMYVDIEKVHPVPRCLVTFDQDNITSKLMKTTTKKIGLFYRVSWYLYYDIKQYSCKGRLHMKCSIGLIHLRVIDVYINYTCQGDVITKKLTQEDTEFILVLSLLFLAFLLFCFGFQYCCKLYLHSLH